MGVMADVGRGPLGLDTAIFIYFIEEHPEFLRLIAPVFAAVAGAKLEAVTSAVTLLETLVVPYRAGDAQLAERYEIVLTRSRGVRLVDLDRPLLRSAAQLRAATSVKTPDALQLAAALRARCTAYLTNDRELPPIPGLRVLQLRDYVRSG
jgi:predicted nucleic acid-binding protein